MELLLVPALLLCLWVAALWLLRGWRYFWLFFAANLALLTLSLYVTTQVLDFGPDAYGLGRILATAGVVAAQAGLGLGFALAWRWRQHRRA